MKINKCFFLILFLVLSCSCKIDGKIELYITGDSIITFKKKDTPIVDVMLRNNTDDTLSIPNYFDVSETNTPNSEMYFTVEYKDSLSGRYEKYIGNTAVENDFVFAEDKQIIRLFPKKQITEAYYILIGYELIPGIYRIKANVNMKDYGQISSPWKIIEITK